MKKLLFSLLLVANAAIGHTFEITHSVDENQGRRKYMEDKHEIREFGPWCLFGVYDGHGGDFVSTFLSEHLGETIEKKLMREDHRQVKSAFLNYIYSSFDKVNQKLKNEHLAQSMHCGSTAVVALINKNTGTVYLAHCGDSRAINSTNITTIDHKPTNKDEIARIDAHNIWHNGIMRLRGSLAITRSFGDFYLEKYGLIATPEIQEFQITSDHDYLVLATDGIWDMLSNEQVKSIVNKHPFNACINSYSNITTTQQIMVKAIKPIPGKRYGIIETLPPQPELLKDAHDNQLVVLVNISKK